MSYQAPGVRLVGNMNDLLRHVDVCCDPAAGVDSWVMEIGADGWRIVVRPQVCRSLVQVYEMRLHRPDDGACVKIRISAPSVEDAVEGAITAIEARGGTCARAELLAIARGLDGSP